MTFEWSLVTRDIHLPGESKNYDTALTKAYTNHQMSNFYWYKFSMPSQDHAKSFLNCTNNLFNQTFLLPTYHLICYLHRLNSEEIYKMCVLKREEATAQNTSFARFTSLRALHNRSRKKCMKTKSWYQTSDFEAADCALIRRSWYLK